MEKRIQRRFYAVLTCCIVFCISAILMVSEYRGGKEMLSETMFVASVSLFLAMGNTAVLLSLLAQRRTMRKTE
ncbi:MULTISPECIES: hypothetical protein [Paenibacillus]|uniref:hypothetical protein n=1 Tax=Paenibacillus TaxID=44249 RepID=UPI0022808959|nr:MULTISPECIES: hypothetical protein [Paenibacillus]MCY7483093.1 hypothetical protein [Paenibacillus alvei]